MSPRILKKKKKAVEKSSFPVLVLVFFSGSILLGFFQLILANALSIYGVRLKELENEKKTFLQQQKYLQNEEAKLVALWRIEKKATEEFSMRKALDSVLYIPPQRFASTLSNLND